MTSDSKLKIGVVKGVLKVTFSGVSFDENDLLRFKADSGVSPESLQAVSGVVIDLTDENLILGENGEGMLFVLIRRYREVAPKKRVILVTGPNERLRHRLQVHRYDCLCEVSEGKTAEEVIDEMVEQI